MLFPMKLGKLHPDIEAQMWEWLERLSKSPDGAGYQPPHDMERAKGFAYYAVVVSGYVLATPNKIYLTDKGRDMLQNRDDGRRITRDLES